MEYVQIITFLALAATSAYITSFYYKKKIKIIESKSKETTDFLTSQIQSLESLKKSAEDTNKLKSQFLANMSHELRTPMHSILSFSKISLKKIGIADNMQLVKYLETVHLSGSRLLNIINEILDISKLESGSTIFEFENSNIDNVVKETIQVCQSFIQDKFIEFEYTNHSSAQEACIDESRIQQVIQNLLANAIKFTPDEGIIQITLYDDIVDGEAGIAFRIDDNGPGLPEGEFKSIFDKFIQSSKTSSGAGGTGLGLCICKELIEAHRGIISACNSISGGASFTFIIPIKQENNQIEIIKTA